MQYLIMCQRNSVRAACFDTKHFIFEGPMFLGDMNATGTIPMLVHGDVFKGKFYPEEEETNTANRE
jgi:hypothetical protein